MGKTFPGRLLRPISLWRWGQLLDTPPGVIRAEESGMSEIDANTVSYHISEPLGVVGQIIPWNFPLLMAAWKMAPALAAGNCVVLKPAEQTPVSVLLFAEMISDLLPNGVLNIVNGFGIEAGKPLASSSRVAKIAFTGETATGRLILQYASENIIPVTLELGGKSPNIFMEDIFDQEDAFIEKSLEGFAMFALNQGEVCTCPSRALIQESIYSRFMEMALARVSKIKAGNPLDTETMIGAQVSSDQMEKIASYIQIGRNEGAKLLIGGSKAKISGLEGGFYFDVSTSSVASWGPPTPMVSEPDLSHSPGQGCCETAIRQATRRIALRKQRRNYRGLASSG